MTFRSEENAVRTALVKCGSDRSKLWQAVTQIAAWCDPIEADLSTESELRERIKAIHKFASEAKEIGT